MAYIGQSPVDTFSPVPSKDSFTGDGSTTTFDLQNSVVNGGENAQSKTKPNKKDPEIHPNDNKLFNKIVEVFDGEILR